MFYLFLPLIATSWDYAKNGGDWDGVCKAGRSQSPIDISGNAINKIGTEDEYYVQLNFTFYEILVNGNFYHESYRILANLGKLEAFSNHEPSPIVEGSIANIHFHSPGEHFLYGKQYDLEMHTVMNDINKEFGFIVFSIFFQIGNTTNEFIDSVIATYNTSVSFTLGGAFESSAVKDFYVYNGSLTVPPCSENVLWLVDSNIRVLHESQLALFQQGVAENTADTIHKGNNREIQFTNGRDIIHFTSNSIKRWIMISLLLILV